jgi:lipopolysaccharide export system protein LptC
MVEPLGHEPIGEDTWSVARPGERWSEAAPSRRNPMRYSRFVSLMKFVLPVCAIGIFAAVLVYSGVFDNRDKLDISFRPDASLPNDDLRMVTPRVAGLDSSGRPYYITADTAVQNLNVPEEITLQNLQADLKFVQGTDWVSVSSDTGLLNTHTELLKLNKDVDLYSTWGYEFHAKSAEIDFRNGSVKSSEPVHGHGPIGTISADSMQADNSKQTIHFEGRVKMKVYGKGGL